MHHNIEILLYIYDLWNNSILSKNIILLGKLFTLKKTVDFLTVYYHFFKTLLLEFDVGMPGFMKQVSERVFPNKRN